MVLAKYLLRVTTQVIICLPVILMAGGIVVVALGNLPKSLGEGDILDSCIVIGTSWAVLSLILSIFSTQNHFQRSKVYRRAIVFGLLFGMFVATYFGIHLIMDPIAHNIKADRIMYWTFWGSNIVAIWNLVRIYRSSELCTIPAGF